MLPATVLLHAVPAFGLTAALVLAGLGLFVLVFAYIFSTLQRDEGREPSPPRARSRSRR